MNVYFTKFEFSCLPFSVSNSEPFIESVQTINIPKEADTTVSTNFVLCKVSYSRCKLLVVGLTFTFLYLLFTFDCAS